MTCLEPTRGKVTTNLNEMRSRTTHFYARLFGAEQCSMKCREELLEELPQLSQEETAALDSELLLEELPSTRWERSGHQGLMGTPLTFTNGSGTLIWTCSHSVSEHGFFLSPVSEQCFLCCPKKEIWPYLRVALLCTDYKVLSRSSSNRLDGPPGNNCTYKPNLLCT